MSKPRPTPYIEIRDYSRFLNVEKLLDIGWMTLDPNGDMTREDVAKIYALPPKDTIEIIGKMRRMEEKDLDQVLKLYQDKMKTMRIYMDYSREEISWMMLPKEGCVCTYVVEDPDNSE